MASAESPAVAFVLSDAVRAKLQGAPAPLKLADVARGLPKARKVKAAEHQENVRKTLEEEVRLGRAFCYPSGKGAGLRYWANDEKQLLRARAVELAGTPQPLSALKTALGKVVKGADGAFVEAVVRELIGDDRLFEHPPPTGKGKSRFGASPPPPPLERDKHRKAVDKLATDCRKLLASAGVTEDELFRALRSRLGQAGSGLASRPASQESFVTAGAEPTPPASDALARDTADLDALILKAVLGAPVLSLAELRDEMPAEFRGRAFDEAVLRLAERQQVIVSQDAEPSRFSPAERAAYVQDGECLFTTIMKRS